MLGSAPHAVVPHDVAALHTAGVGLVPHHAQVIPLAGAQLTNVSALRWVEQSVVEHERLMWVNPVRVAAVAQLGKMFVLLVLLLPMLAAPVPGSPTISASGRGGGPPGMQFCPWWGAKVSVAAACVRHGACTPGDKRPTNVAASPAVESRPGSRRTFRR